MEPIGVIDIGSNSVRLVEVALEAGAKAAAEAWTLALADSFADEPATDLTVARLWLCEATRIVLANGLRLLGVSAPERM